MEIPDLETIISAIDQRILHPVKNILDTLPPDYVPFILITAAAVALIVTLLVIIITRPSKNKKRLSTGSILSALHKEGAIVDVALPGAPTSICGRGIITTIKKGRIRLDIIENGGSILLKPEVEIMIMFRPENTSEGRINSFRSTILKTEKKDGICTGLSITIPESYSNTKRRRYRRKRVVDQQFIRVKIWNGNPSTAETGFQDSVPDLAINSYDPRAGGHEDNSVINISNGGIAVNAMPEIVEDKFINDSDVLLNIFMFNFRQKIFKPYWYAGKIRSIEQGHDNKSRLGIEFTYSGTMIDEDEQEIIWSEL